ncbi:MAG: hypothetical protein OXI67_04240 [Candidatus Poribacteria bacterium]|nr:hypothetical protein [Candidatus Poribacteria bacterium]
MKKWVIFIIIALFIVAAAVSLYLPATSVNVPDSSCTPLELPATVKFQGVQHWDQLDLAAIKRDYQPYTVAEMREMWEAKLIVKYGGAERLKQAVGEANHVYPQDMYLARMLELGRPFVDFSDYEDALTDQRIRLFSMRMYWNSMSTTERAIYLKRQGLPPDATWNIYEETLLKNDVVDSINFWRSKELDPYIKGPAEVLRHK